MSESLGPLNKLHKNSNIKDFEKFKEKAKKASKDTELGKAYQQQFPEEKTAKTSTRKVNKEIPPTAS